jgi:glycogen operon protein
MFNAWRHPLEFELPLLQELSGGCWYRWLDTSLSSPDDIVPIDEVSAVDGRTYNLPPHSLVVLLDRAPAEGGKGETAGADENQQARGA